MSRAGTGEVLKAPQQSLKALACTTYNLARRVLEADLIYTQSTHNLELILSWPEKLAASSPH